MELCAELLQGWQPSDPYHVCAPHPLAALLEFELLRNGAPTGTLFCVRGLAATLGRYTPATGPVDLDLGTLQEYERLHIGMPHVRVGQDLDGWRVEAITPYFPTFLNGQPLGPGGGVLIDGSLLVLGDVTFRVNQNRPPSTPNAARPRGAVLRLKRDGALTGIQIPLSPQGAVLGRSSPQTGPVDIELGALPDHERVHIGRRHARLRCADGRWFVEPLHGKPVFVNRQPALQAERALSSGDELALGNVMFVFTDLPAGEGR